MKLNGAYLHLGYRHMFFVTTSAPCWIQTVEMSIFMKYSRTNFTESFVDTDADQ